MFLLAWSVLPACGDENDYGEECRRTGLMVGPGSYSMMQLTRDSLPIRVKTPPRARKQCPHDFEIHFGWIPAGMDNDYLPPLDINCGSPLRRVHHLTVEQYDDHWMAQATRAFDDDLSANPIYLFCEFSYIKGMHPILLEVPIWLEVKIAYRGVPEDSPSAEER